MAPSPASKPALTPSKASSTPRKDSLFTQQLLLRAHSDAETTRIMTDKITHKPLTLYATRLPSQPATATTTTASITPNEREIRRLKRTTKASSSSKKTHTKRANAPLSAAQKRRLCLLDIPRAEQKWHLYVGLHKLWIGYMRTILGLTPGKVLTQTPAAAVAVMGPKVAAADMHGALLEVVRSRCVGRVGVKGIVVRDTKFTFVVVTKGDAVKIVPKEGTVFRLTVPLHDTVEERASGKKKGDGGGGSMEDEEKLVFEVYGDQFKTRAPERATKKFRWHLPKDL